MKILLSLVLLSLGSKPVIVCTLPPIQSLVSAVGGESFSYSTLLPKGYDPHTFEPRPGQIQKIEGAAIIFAAGLGIDSWADKLNERNRKLVKLGDEIAQRGLKVSNPHFWLDPELAKRTLFLIADELSRIDPTNWEKFYRNACEYSSRISEFVKEMRLKLQKSGVISLIVYHDAWTGFAKAFGFDVAAVIAKNPSIEPTLTDIERVVKIGRAKNVKVILKEKPFPGKLPETLARELGSKVAIVDPLFEGDYIKGMRANVNSILEALK